MTVYLTALNPTASVTLGLLPAAARLGRPVVVLTDDPASHAAAYARLDARVRPAVERADVRDAGAVAARLEALAARHGSPAALLSNSDHLQTPTALAAGLLGLPGKDWRATLRCKNKSLTRSTLAAAGLDTVACLEIGPGDDAVEAAAGLPFPAVVKPREGVASEDVVLVGDLAELVARVADIRERRPDATLVAEEYLAGPLHTYETLGDGTELRHVSSWRTTLGEPPYFTESRRDWVGALPAAVEEHLRAQLAALGVGFGACHTEFVVQGDRARIIEVNYRLIGDTMDLICSELLGADLFEALLRVHLGERLPAHVPTAAGVDRHVHIRYLTAEAPGTLVESPEPQTAGLPGGIVLGHRRLREPGVTAPLHGTNRDYLSVVHAIAPTAESASGAVEDFVAANRWVVSA